MFAPLLLLHYHSSTSSLALCLPHPVECGEWRRKRTGLRGWDGSPSEWRDRSKREWRGRRRRTRGRQASYVVSTVAARGEGGDNQSTPPTAAKQQRGKEDREQRKKKKNWSEFAPQHNVRPKHNHDTTGERRRGAVAACECAARVVRAFSNATHRSRKV